MTETNNISYLKNNTKIVSYFDCQNMNQKRNVYYDYFSTKDEYKF